MGGSVAVCREGGGDTATTRARGSVATPNEAASRSRGTGTEGVQVQKCDYQEALVVPR